MRIRRSLAFVPAVLAATALALAGCSAPEEESSTGGTSAPSAEAGAIPVTIDHIYGSTTIDTAPTRVAAMGVGDADTLLALGITPTTIAPFADPTQRSAPWNKDLLGDAEPVILPNVAAQFGDQIAKALATNPDLITAVGAAPTREQYESLSKAVPTIPHSAGYPDWQVPWDVQTTEIGRAVGLPEAAQAQIDKTKAFLEKVRTDNPEFAGKTGVVVVGAPDGTVSIYAEGDGRGQTLLDYGLGFPEQLRPAITAGFYGTLSAENLNLLDTADVVVALDWAGSNAALKKNAAWNALSIVKSGKVSYLDQQVGSAMSVPTVLTIPWVAHQAVGPIAEAVAK